MERAAQCYFLQGLVGPLRDAKSRSEGKWEPPADFTEENGMTRIAFSINHSAVVWTTDWRPARLGRISKWNYEAAAVIQADVIRSRAKSTMANGSPVFTVCQPCSVINICKYYCISSS